MLPEDKQQRIEQIRKVVQDVRVAPLSTVNTDFTPHCSPVFMTFDADYNAIWSSDPLSQHSLNITRTGQVFIVAFDSSCKTGGGLYLEARASNIPVDDPDFASALAVYAQAKEAFGAPAPVASDFAQPDGQRLYIAVPSALWINYSTKDEQGKVVRDQRFRVTVAALQGK